MSTTKMSLNRRITGILACLALSAIPATGQAQFTHRDRDPTSDEGEGNGRESGGRENGGQENGGQENGGQENGGQENGGQENGGQKNGGQENGGQKNGGFNVGNLLNGLLGGQTGGGQTGGGWKPNGGQIDPGWNQERPHQAYKPQQRAYQPPPRAYQPPPRQPPTTWNSYSTKAFAVPKGYDGYQQGSLINYFGTVYRIGLGSMEELYIAPPGYPLSPPKALPKVYAIPEGYKGYRPGSVVNYGSESYRIGTNGTMVSVPAEPRGFAIPKGYEIFFPGMVVNYGGKNYRISSTIPNTMVESPEYAPGLTPSNPVPKSKLVGENWVVEWDKFPMWENNPPLGTRIPLPPDVQSSPGGLNRINGLWYFVWSDGTMNEYTTTIPYYVVPLGYEKATPGKIIHLAGSDYEIVGDGTMKAAKFFLNAPFVKHEGMSAPGIDRRAGRELSVDDANRFWPSSKEVSVPQEYAKLPLGLTFELAGKHYRITSRPPVNHYSNANPFSGGVSTLATRVPAGTSPLGTGMFPGKRYIVPNSYRYGMSNLGRVIKYNNVSYIIHNDGTMTEGDWRDYWNAEYGRQPIPVAWKAYFPGTLVKRGNQSFLIGEDGLMIPIGEDGRPEYFDGVPIKGIGKDGRPVFGDNQVVSYAAELVFNELGPPVTPVGTPVTLAR